MKKILTIGIAVYNIKEEYLRRCIDSAVSNLGDSVEIIIADDCSEEFCSKVCREYSANDKRIVYVRNSKNKGISGVRNMIIDMASGEWLTFVDGDDMIASDVGKILTENDLDAYDLLMFGNETFTDSNFVPKSDASNAIASSIVPLGDEEIYDMAVASIARRGVLKFKIDGLNINPGSVWAVTYRTDFLKQGGFRFDENLKTAEDSVFKASVFLKKPKTAVYTKTEYYYRLNPNSVTNRYDEHSKNVTDAYLKAITAFLDNNFKDGEVMDEFLKNRCARAVTDNFERNIFHRDNPKTYSERKREFCSLLESEPYKAAVSVAQVADIDNHKLRLNIMLAKKHMFGVLNLCYKFDVLFKIYGGLSHRINKLKKRY